MVVYNELTGLPYPYEIYEMHKSLTTAEYVKLITGWVKKNTLNIDIDKKLELIQSIVEKTHTNQKVIELLTQHKDRIRCMADLSGLAFAVIVNEAEESITLRFPSPYGIYHEYYNGYDANKFMKLDIDDKIRWLIDHCEFIPLLIRRERLDPNDGISHKFSHIRMDKHIMDLLKPWMDSIKYIPNDRNYYFIRHTMLNGKYQWYLQRDTDASPINIH